MAVVKVMKVADNRQVTVGNSESSEFYKIFGGKVDNMGMYLEQKNDAGLNLFWDMPWMVWQDTQVGWIFHFQIYGWFGSSPNPGKHFTSLLVYVEGAYDNREYTDLSDDPFEFTRVSLGIGKTYIFLVVFILNPILDMA